MAVTLASLLIPSLSLNTTRIVIIIYIQLILPPLLLISRCILLLTRNQRQYIQKLQTANTQTFVLILVPVFLLSKNRYYDITLEFILHRLKRKIISRLVESVLYLYRRIALFITFLLPYLQLIGKRFDYIELFTQSISCPCLILLVMIY